MYKFVTSANYFGEIVEWFGYGIASWNLCAFLFAFGSFMILFPRAYQHHQWYKKKFDNYPKNRKIIIPFLI